MDNDTEQLPKEPQSEDRRKHLEFIQGAVGRMSSASSTAKGWLLPVVTAAYGFALTNRSVPVTLLGIAAVLVFGFLDMNYLRQERAFRALYRDAVDGKVPPYEMDVQAYLSRRSYRRLEVLGSWAIAGFYVPLVLVGLLVLALSLCL